MDAIIRSIAALLVPLFFLGMIGSLLVVLVTVVRDLGQIIASDEENE